MLDRLEIAFAGQKDFLTDVGHELRTPITVIRGSSRDARRLAGRARRGDRRDPGPKLDRMSRYVDDLLLLAKAPGPTSCARGRIDLDLFTHDLFRQGA